MTKRRAAQPTNPQREVDIGSRPVESRVNKESTPVTEVRIPRSQAFWTALPWSVACAVTALWPIVVGQHIFYVATACGALATFIWMLRNETEWSSMLCAPFVPGVGGFVLWRFYEFVGWKGYVLTVVSGCSVLFWWLFSTASTLTFVQRLGMPMFHQQFHIWKALGNALESFLGIAMKRPPAHNGPRPIFNRSERRAETELPEREPDPVNLLAEIELFLMLAQDKETIKRDGGLAGLTMANGQKVSKSLWARNMQILYEQGYVTNGGSGYAWATGQSAQTALDALV